MYKTDNVVLSALKPLKQLKNRSIYTFDCETKDGLKGKSIFCWSICRNSKNNTKSQFDIQTGYDNNFDSLFDFLPKSSDKNKHLTVIYVHNLSFDIRFIIDYLVRKDIEYKKLISGSNFIELTIPSLKIKFQDTFQFLLTSQHKAEIDWNIPKEFTKISCQRIFRKPYKYWTQIEKNRVIEHNKNDVKALLLIMKAFRKEIYELGKVDCITCHSLASLAMKFYRMQLPIDEGIINPFLWFNKKEKKYEEKHEGKWERFVRESYFGGRNEVFNMNTQLNAVYIDRVSMYPSEMAFNKFPNCIPFELKDKEKLMKIISIEGNSCEGFILAKIIPIEMKYPILPERMDNKIMFTNCIREKVYALPELRYAYSLGYKIEPKIGLIYAHSDYIFKTYIDTLFEVKKNNKGGKRNCAKILMNSLYGKFGQHFHQKDTIMHYFKTATEQIDFIDESEQNNIKLLSNKYSDESELYISIESTDSVSLKPYMNIAIASYVTSYARIALHKKMMEIDKIGIEIFYCDTDSVTIENSNIDKIKIGKELGNWDIEQTFEAVKFLAPKAYISIQNGILNLKLKGVSRDKIKEICNSNESLEEIEIEIRKEIQMSERYACYKESHRHGQILSTKTPHKMYSFENLKRKFENGTSIAWNDSTLPEKFKFNPILS